MTDLHASPPADPAPPLDRPTLRRSRRNTVVAGVCGGLGRHFDLDPVIFRIVLAVLTVTGGVGLIFYGFAWLLVPLEGEEENEAKKLLTGRVEGGTLAALLASLVGCALFLSLLNNGATSGFTVLSVVAVGAAVHWAQRRRGGRRPAAESEPDAAHIRAAEAPPETQAPPVPGSPSWWRDPLVKDGTTGHSPTGYLWGPEEAGATDRRGAGPGRSPRPRPYRARGGGIGGRVFVLAVLAGAAATASVWHGQPLGHALQVGLAAALAVFGLGLAVSSFTGRTGFGTVVLAVVTAGLLAGAAALPRDIGTEWREVTWRPASVAELRPSYDASNGYAVLDLSRLDVPRGTTVAVGASLDAGKLKVIVPRQVTARAGIEIRVGDVQLPGERADRLEHLGRHSQHTTLKPAAGTEAGGTIELRLKTGVGQVEVARAAS
ncbi:PspC domain-containing protein [Streptomyces sp. NPDC090022]|uniref:PspC domain-containing protein n=1 Tax=Streptomyces sp. NPDC090022 TaxID=3365920 RepID=UPI0038050757